MRLIDNLKRLFSKRAVIANSITSIDDIPTSIQIAPYGEFEKDGIVQVCDAQAFDNIVQQTKLPVLIDIDHQSLDGKTEAYGWIRNIYKDADGLFGDVEWTPLGQDAISQKIVRQLSPAWFIDKTGRPDRLHSVALTNTPNIDGIDPLFNFGNKDRCDYCNEQLEAGNSPKFHDHCKCTFEDVTLKKVDEYKGKRGHTRSNPFNNEETITDMEEDKDIIEKPMQENACKPIKENEEIVDTDTIEALKAESASLKSELAAYKDKELEAGADAFVNECGGMVEDPDKLKAAYKADPEKVKEIIGNIKKSQPVCNIEQRFIDPKERFTTEISKLTSPEERVKYIQSLYK